MIKIFIFGISGKIGKSIVNFIKINKKIILLGGINKNNFYNFEKKYEKIFFNMKKNGIIIDFSNSFLLKKILFIVKKYLIPIIIGTTGFNLNDFILIKKVSISIPIIVSYNMSIGLNIINFFLSNINLYLKKYNFLSFLIDIHHNKKVDSPSGTLLMLLSKIKIINLKSVSIRIKNIIGNHILYFISNYEMIKIEHFVFCRKIFIIGIFYSIYWLLKKTSGCYSMYDVFF